MRTLFITLFILLTQANFSQLLGQTQAIHYSGVAVGSNGQALRNKQIQLQLAILEGDSLANPVFIERHLVRTDQNGAFSTIIGRAQAIFGSFDDIDWANFPVYLRVELDPNGGTNFQVIAIDEFLPVPYAIFTGESGNQNDHDRDSTNEFQDLSILGDQLTISDGNTITLPGDINDHDRDSTNEFQNLSILGDELTISEGNTIRLPTDINDHDRDSTNEFQNLSILGDQLTISDGNTITLPGDPDDHDRDSTNEFQDLSILGDQLTISEGNTITLPTDINDHDRDSTNEFQNLSILGDELTISEGNTITLPTDINDHDRDSTNEFQTIQLLNDTIRLSHGGGGIPINEIFNSSSPRFDFGTFEWSPTRTSIIRIKHSGNKLPALIEFKWFSKGSYNYGFIVNGESIVDANKLLATVYSPDAPDFAGSISIVNTFEDVAEGPVIVTGAIRRVGGRLKIFWQARISEITKKHIELTVHNGFNLSMAIVANWKITY